MSFVTRVRGELVYQRTHRLKARLRDEQWGCGDPRGAARGDQPHDVFKRASEPHEAWARIKRTKVGETFHVDPSRMTGGGTVLKDLPGAGKVYDWRDSSWTPVSGGRISPLVFVQHIPVVPNVDDSIADFIRLRDVLVAQGLMVHAATDRDGNVALYTPFDYLNYHARGANAVSCGCEHMHMSTGERWTEKQFRAAAWVVNLAKEKHGIPANGGELAGGGGVVRVVDKGQVSHQRVSSAAGFNDRTDPGGGYDFGHVRDLVMYWREHGTFIGAPS